MTRTERAVVMFLSCTSVTAVPLIVAGNAAGVTFTETLSRGSNCYNLHSASFVVWRHLEVYWNLLQKHSVDVVGLPSLGSSWSLCYG